MTICPKCGKETKTGNFCGKCGTRLSGIKKDLPETKETTSHKTKIDPCNDLKNNKPELSELETHIKAFPNDPIGYIKLAELQIKNRESSRAYSSYRAAAALAPDNAEVLKKGSEILESLGKTNEAIDNLTRAIKNSDDPSDKDMTRLASLLESSGQKKKALVWLGKAINIDPNNEKALMKIASIYLSIGNIDESEKFIAHCKETFAPSPEQYYLEGEILSKRAQYDEAENKFKEGIKKFPKNGTMNLGLGRAYLGIDDKSRAIMEFESALEKDPLNTEILTETAKLQSILGFAKEAEKNFESVRKSPDSTGEQLYNIALHFLEMQNSKKAEEFLYAALNVSPFLNKAAKQLSEILFEQEKYKEASDIYKSELEKDSSCQWALNGMKITAELTGDLKAKAASLKNLLDKDRDNYKLWSDYADTLSQMKLFKEAEQAYTEAASLNPAAKEELTQEKAEYIKRNKEEGQELFTQAQESFNRGLLVPAANMLDKALKLCPDILQWQRLRADIAFKTADIKKAGAIYSQLYSQGETDPLLEFALASVYETEGKFKQAAEILGDAVKKDPDNLDMQIKLLKLKRLQLRSTDMDKKAIEVMAGNTEAFTSNARNPYVSQIVKAYAYYIYSYRSKFHQQGIEEASKLFEHISSQKGLGLEKAINGLLLCARIQNHQREAIDLAHQLVKGSAGARALFNLGKLHENFQQYNEARKCYASLKELYPDNPLYRRKVVETTAAISATGTKNELLNLLSDLSSKCEEHPDDLWMLYEKALSQEMAAKLAPQQKEEWIKQAMISWQQALKHPSANYWISWEAGMCRLNNQIGLDKIKGADHILRIYDNILTEIPNNPVAHIAVAKCHLAYNELSHTDAAMTCFEKACFLAPTDSETGLLIAETAKYLGKTEIISAVGYGLILTEPETADRIFDLL